jgi:hypothetical protein
MSHRLRHCPLALNFLNKSTDPLQCQTAQFHFSESGICMLTGKQRPNAAQPTRTKPVVIPFAARLPPPPSRPPTATPSSPLSLRNGRAAELAAAGRARMARSMSPALRATTSSSTTGTSAIEVYRTRTPPPSPHPLEITMTANFVNGGGAFAREIF